MDLKSLVKSYEELQGGTRLIHVRRFCNSVLQGQVKHQQNMKSLVKSYEKLQGGTRLIHVRRFCNFALQGGTLFNWTTWPRLEDKTSILPYIPSPSGKSRDLFNRSLELKESRYLKKDRVIKQNLASSLRCAILSHLAYKNPTFVKGAMKNAFFMSILGTCNLTLRHDKSSDVRMLCYYPKIGKSIFAVRGTAIGSVAKNENTLEENLNYVDILADLFIGVLGFQKFGLAAEDKFTLLSNLYSALASSVETAMESKFDAAEILKNHGIFQSTISFIYDYILFEQVGVVKFINDKNVPKLIAGSSADANLKSILTGLLGLLNAEIKKSNQTFEYLNDDNKRELKRLCMGYICSNMQDPTATNSQRYSGEFREEVVGNDEEANSLLKMAPKNIKDIADKSKQLFQYVKNIYEMIRENGTFSMASLVLNGTDAMTQLNEISTIIKTYRQSFNELTRYLFDLNRLKVKSIRNYLLSQNAKVGRLLITGHSLGGYLAFVTQSVLEDHVNIQAITFNQPFTGIMGAEDYFKNTGLLQKAWRMSAKTVNRALGGDFRPSSPSILKYQYINDVVSRLDTDQFADKTNPLANLLVELSSTIEITNGVDSISEALCKA